jgi:hypothetical protein
LRDSLLTDSGFIGQTGPELTHLTIVQLGQAIKGSKKTTGAVCSSSRRSRYTIYSCSKRTTFAVQERRSARIGQRNNRRLIDRSLATYRFLIASSEWLPTTRRRQSVAPINPARRPPPKPYRQEGRSSGQEEVLLFAFTLRQSQRFCSSQRQG